MATTHEAAAAAEIEQHPHSHNSNPKRLKGLSVAVAALCMLATSAFGAGTISLSILIPYARNARTHNEEQVAQIAASIREWGWTNPVLVAEDGTIIAGHGQVLAARKLRIADVPVMVASG